MQRFVSAQTYAERTSFDGRLGFTVVPVPNSGTGPPVESRVAAAIHDSQTDPTAACTAAGESCDFDVADAVYIDSWKSLANTQEGVNVAVQVAPDVTVSVDAVSGRGATWLTSSPTTQTPPGWAPPALRTRSPPAR